MNKQDIKLLGVRDVVKLYGSSPQYWSRLMKEGKIEHWKTSSGRMTTPEWVQHYLDNRLPPGRPRKQVDNVEQ